jgi:hypothetical protein
MHDTYMHIHTNQAFDHLVVSSESQSEYEDDTPPHTDQSNRRDVDGNKRDIDGNKQNVDGNRRNVDGNVDTQPKEHQGGCGDCGMGECDSDTEQSEMSEMSETQIQNGDIRSFSKCKNQEQHMRAMQELMDADERGEDTRYACTCMMCVCMSVCMHMWVHVCVCLCVCVCVYIYIYIYIYIYEYT